MNVCTNYDLLEINNTERKKRTRKRTRKTSKRELKRVEAAAKINKIGVSFVFLLANAGKRPLGFGLAGLGRAGLGVDDVLSPPPPPFRPSPVH